MSLQKSAPSQHYQPAAPEPQDQDYGQEARVAAPAAARVAAPAPAASGEQFARRGSDFGRKPSTPSADTYVKLRFSDSPDMPETWFKLNVYPNGVHAFEPTTSEHPVVLLMNKGDSKLRMYHFDDSSNFDEIGPKRFEGVRAEIQVRKRRDSTPENPQMFLAGTYFERDGNPPRELRGNLVGAMSKDLMNELSHASYAEWKASRPPREESAPAQQAPKTVELVAGQELDFSM